jgi:hypothetical protein
MLVKVHVLRQSFAGVRRVYNYQGMQHFGIKTEGDEGERCGLSRSVSGPVVPE